MILALKTDQVESELYLVSHEGITDEYKWQAHRELSNTIFEKIDELLQKNNLVKSGLTGLVVYQGPGSFTGLRIGISVANAMSYGLQIPISAATGKFWLNDGIKKVSDTKYSKDQIIIPEYGSEAHTTKPRK